MRQQPIPNFPGYEITDTGQIYSHSKKGFLKDSSTPNGYLRIILYKQGKQYPKTIHRLVAEFFVFNLKSDEYNQVNHIDGNKQNNHYTNLEWSTPIHNQEHAMRHGFQKHGIRKSKYLGVSWHKSGNKHWRANINVRGEAVDLGRFMNETKAAVVYDFAGIKYNLNGPLNRDKYAKDFSIETS